MEQGESVIDIVRLIDNHLQLRSIDEDLAAMYLTDKRNGHPKLLNDHEELEVLLESFAKQVEEIVNEAENMHVRDPPRCVTYGSSCRRVTFNLRKRLSSLS